LIVQHIAPGFVQGFADWLANSCRIPVKIATRHEFPLPGHAYIARTVFIWDWIPAEGLSLKEVNLKMGCGPLFRIFFALLQMFLEKTLWAFSSQAWGRRGEGVEK